MLTSSYKEHYRKTFQLAIPVCISQLGHIMVSVTDVAFVGHIGHHQQAAVQLSGSLFTLFLIFGLGISIGVTPLVAAAHSQENKDELKSLLKNSFYINIITSVLLFILLLAMSPILRHFGQDATVAELAIPFMNVMMLSMIPLAVYSTFKQFAEGMSDTIIAMIVSVGCNLLNILLNYVLVFGHWGFPEMGMMGSCWASFISRVLMGFAMFAYVRYSKKFKQYFENFGSIKANWIFSLKILKIGVPSAFQWIFEVGVFSFAAIMIGWIGAKEQAAHSIALNLAAVTYMIALGLSAAVTVRVGNFVGINDKKNIRKAGFSGLYMVIAFECVTAFLFVLFKNYLPTLFSVQPEVILLASQLLIVAAFFQLSDGIQVIGLGALRGLNDTTIPTAITLVSYWVIGLPVSYVLAFTLNLGALGIWYGLFLGLTVAAVSLIWRFNYVSGRFVVAS